MAYSLELQAKIDHGRRMAKLYAITDPLWKAIAAGRNQEVARLQGQLSSLLAKDSSNGRES